MMTHWRALRIVIPVAVIVVPPRTQQLQLRDHPGIVAAVIDHARQRVVAVGGHGTAEWDGASWRVRPPAPFDVASSVCGMAYDLARARSVLVGHTAMGSMRTLTFDGVAWADALPLNSPPARTGFALACDFHRAEVVLFGGANSGFSAPPRNDTWVFDGQNWSQRLPPNSPTPRHSTATAFDWSRGRIVMFGGMQPTGNQAPVANWQHLDETWEWDGATWTQAAPVTIPWARTRAAMTYDATRSRTVLYGGVAGSGAILADHWEFDGTNWQPMTAVTPGPRSDSALVYDAAAGECLLLGGNIDSGRQSLQTWAFDGSQWSLRSDPRQPGMQSAGRPIAAASPLGNGIVRLVADAGQSRTWTWTWSGGWTELTIPAPPARTGGVTAIGNQFAYLYGGRTPGGQPLDDLWIFDGTSWQQIAVAGPGAGERCALAFDLVRSELVLYGGANSSGQPLGETWVFAGSGWQRRQPTVSPPPRHFATLTFDPVRSRTVLHGGWTGSAFNDTWLWDGTTWSQVITPTLPPYGNMVSTFDAQRRAVVMMNQPDSDRFWSFDGVNWTQHVLAGTDGALRDRVLVGWPYPNGTLVVEEGNLMTLSQVPAAAAPFGSPCSPAAPAIAANQRPFVGATTFGIDIVGGPPNSLVALLGAPTSANVPLLGCTQLVPLGAATVLLPTNPSGFATAALPMPIDAAFAGIGLSFQAAALDPTAPHGVTLSSGHRIVIGD